MRGGDAETEHLIVVVNVELDPVIRKKVLTGKITQIDKIDMTN